VAYGTQILHQPRDFLLTALVTAGLVSFVTIPLSGHLSDRFGRKRIYLIGSVATGVFGFIYFAMLNTMVPGWIFLGIVLSFVPHDVMYGPQAALIVECFTAAAAVQRLLDRLSARLGHRRRPGTAYRYSAARRDRVRLRDRRLHRLLRRGQHYRDGPNAGLHQP
jgi:MFS family permease